LDERYLSEVEVPRMSVKTLWS